MVGGGARRGTLVPHYGTGHRRPAPRPRYPRDETGSCGSQPAHQSVIDRRLQRRPRPCATFDRLLATELIGRRTLMPYALETGHESGATEIDEWLISLAPADQHLVGDGLEGEAQPEQAAERGVRGAPPVEAGDELVEPRVRL